MVQGGQVVQGFGSRGLWSTVDTPPSRPVESGWGMWAVLQHNANGRLFCLLVFLLGRVLIVTLSDIYGNFPSYSNLPKYKTSFRRIYAFINYIKWDKPVQPVSYKLVALQLQDPALVPLLELILLLSFLIPILYLFQYETCF